MPVNLYSYCILYDNGAAPNPFWNVCTVSQKSGKLQK
jgi:hypothetical protein